MNSHDIKSKVKTWWETLATREKQAVAVGGGAVGLFIIYAAIWSPLDTLATNARKRIVTQQKTLVWMQSADAAMQKMQGEASEKNKAVSPVALLTLMQKQINASGLDQALTQLKQSSNDAIEVHFQKVSFDKLIALLMTVMKGQAVSVSQLAVIADSTPGIVNADMVMKMGR